MTRLVVAVKCALLVISAGWCVYAANALILLTRTFPVPKPESYNLEDFIASIQGYSVVFGPLVVSAAFLLIRWPSKKNDDQKR
jgi:hypothetical protein